jgi:hypothetical protein
LPVNHRKPWYRKSKDTWYVEIDGRQVQLAKGKDAGKAAETKFHELTLKRVREEAVKADPGTIPARAVCALYLIAAAKTVEGGTFEWYKRYLQSFCERHGSVRAAPRGHSPLWPLCQTQTWPGGEREPLCHRVAPEEAGHSA